jgi:hypothetical protein
MKMEMMCSSKTLGLSLKCTTLQLFIATITTASNPTMKGYRSVGIDYILAELIQAGGKTLCFHSLNVINSVCNKEEPPQKWKESIIVPIYEE